MKYLEIQNDNIVGIYLDNCGENLIAVSDDEYEKLQNGCVLENGEIVETPKYQIWKIEKTLKEYQPRYLELKAMEDFLPSNLLEEFQLLESERKTLGERWKELLEAL